MNPSSPDLLKRLMAEANIFSIEELAQQARVSERQVYRLRQGLVTSMSVTNVTKLAQALNISLEELVQSFLSNDAPGAFPSKINPAELEALQTECDRLKQELAQQQSIETQLKQEISEKDAKAAKKIEELKAEQEKTIQTMRSEFGRLEDKSESQSDNLRSQWEKESLATIESWLLQWSAAANAAQSNSDFPAKALVMLAKPFDALLESWDVSPNAVVGETVPFDPQQHQVAKHDASIKPGDPVIVQNAGYLHGDRLLHRAKVIAKEPETSTKEEKESSAKGFG